MPNIERVTGKIFAENASPVGNNPEIGKFGNAKQGIFTGEANISEIQNSEAWSQGWTGAIVSNNNYPPLPEMNGVLKNLSQQVCYLLQKGVPEWDSGTTYYTNDYVNYKGVLYFSTIDNNTTEPTTAEGGNNWKSGTVDLPIATTSSIGAVQPDGTTIGVNNNGIIKVNEDLINQIDNSVNKTECKAYIIETYQNEASYYRVWSDGWCEQSYVIDVVQLGQTITLLKPYRDTKYTIQLSITDTDLNAAVDGIATYLYGIYTDYFIIVSGSYITLKPEFHVIKNSSFNIKGYISEEEVQKILNKEN